MFLLEDKNGYIGRKLNQNGMEYSDLILMNKSEASSLCLTKTWEKVQKAFSNGEEIIFPSDFISSAKYAEKLEIEEKERKEKMIIKIKAIAKEKAIAWGLNLLEWKPERYFEADRDNSDLLSLTCLKCGEKSSFSFGEEVKCRNCEEKAIIATIPKTEKELLVWANGKILSHSQEFDYYFCEEGNVLYYEDEDGIQEWDKPFLEEVKKGLIYWISPIGRIPINL